MQINTVHVGSTRHLAGQLAPNSLHSIVTSPPYFGLRSYLPNDHPLKPEEIGTEKTPEEYVANLVALFAALRSALRDDGTLWLNLGDSYVGALSQHREGGSQGWNSPISKKTMSGIPTDGRIERNRLLRENGVKPKDLIGIPWMVAFALRTDGWYLRSDIIWAKKNCMPESVRDRPTRSHEYIFLLSKSARYYYDSEAIKEPVSDVSLARVRQPNFANQQGGEKDYGKTGVNGSRSMRKTLENFAKQDGHGKRHAGFNDRCDFTNPRPTRNKRDVWHVGTVGYPEAHYATFPPELIRPCILAGTPPGGTVLDPFVGSGTVAQVATQEGRNWLGFDVDERSPGFTARRLAKLPPREQAAD